MSMKKLLVYFTAATIAMAAASCEKKGGPEKEKEDPITLDLAPESLTFLWDEDLQDKTVTATTNYTEALEVDVNYTDTERIDWLDVQVDGTDILVAVTSDNTDAEERPREATVTVKAGEVTKDLAVTQAAYIETDFSMVVAPTSLEFAPAGEELTKTLTVTTNAATISVTEKEEKDWISTSVDGKTISVTVLPNEDEIREATLVISNPRIDAGGEVEVVVTQYGTPSGDISGNWIWTSLNFPEVNAESIASGGNMEGAVTISIEPGKGYKIKSIRGMGAMLVEMLTANPDAVPTMNIRQDGDKLYVGMFEDEVSNGDRFNPGVIKGDLWFQTGAAASLTYYFSGPFLAANDDPTAGYRVLHTDIEIERSVEFIDGVATEVLTFPTSYKGDGVLSYVNYQWFRGNFIGIDFHRNLVLRRPLAN